MRHELSNLNKKIIDLCQQKKYEEAEALLDSADVDNKAFILNLRGKIEKRRGDKAQALFYFTKAIDEDLEEPCYLFDRSWLYLQEGHPQESYHDAEAALAVGQRRGFDYYDEVATFFCAQSLFEMGRYNEALAYALKLPDDFRMWVNRLHTKEELVQACQAHLTGRG